MEGERIENIIQELTQLDPDLKTHEAELRALVSLIIAKRPTVRIDDAFRASLRERLLSGSPKSVPSPYAELSWWAMRLVPLGAVALLLITLVPGDILEAPQTIDESYIASEMADMSDDERILDVERGGAPSAPPSNTYGIGGGGSGPRGTDDAALDSTMSMKALPQEPLPFTISPQTPGPSIIVDSISVGAPSFIVIYTYLSAGREQMVGVSPLIMPGTTVGVPVYLKTPTYVGQFYRAVLHTDNGNRVFTYEDDAPSVDGYGNPIRYDFEVVSRYFE